MLRKHRKVIIKKSRPSLSQSQEDPSNPDGDDKAEDQNYEYKCRYCDRSFKKSVSLGGHISKSHNGKSDLYKKKMEIRQSRE